MAEARGGDDLVTRYTRAAADSQELAEAQRAAAQGWDRRVKAEDELGIRQKALRDLSGLGVGAWRLRFNGELAGRKAAAESAVKQSEAAVEQAVAAHKVAAVRVMLTQGRADDLPAAREAAIAALSGSEAESARGALTAANELSEALFAAQSAHLAALGVSAQLATASTYSTYDTFFGGGFTASTMKQDALHSAGDASQPLVDSLAKLRSELQDLNAPTAYFAVQTGDLTGSLDVWWDNVFSDLAMAKRINDAQDRIQRLIAGLEELEAKLGERRLTALARLDLLITSGSRASGSGEHRGEGG